MDSPIVYVYISGTGEFDHSYEPQEDPMAPGEYITPEFSTWLEPLPAMQGKAVCFNTQNQAWEYVDDIRGFWFDPTGEAHDVQSLLDSVPSTWERTKPVFLHEVKADQRALINSQRDADEAGGFEFQGHTYDSDSRAVQRITVAAQAAQAAASAGEEFAIDWTLQDNSVVTLSVEQMLALPVALAEHGNQVHLKARNLKALIDAATTVEQVLAIVWENE